MGCCSTHELVNRISGTHWLGTSPVQDDVGRVLVQADRTHALRAQKRMLCDIFRKELDATSYVATHAAQQAARTAQELSSGVAFGRPACLGLPVFRTAPVLIMSCWLVPSSFSVPVPGGTVGLPRLILWGISSPFGIGWPVSLFREVLPLLRSSLSLVLLYWTWTWS